MWFGLYGPLRAYTRGKNQVVINRVLYNVSIAISVWSDTNTEQLEPPGASNKKKGGGACHIIFGSTKKGEQKMLASRKEGRMIWEMQIYQCKKKLR